MIKEKNCDYNLLNGTLYQKNRDIGFIEAQNLYFVFDTSYEGFVGVNPCVYPVSLVCLNHDFFDLPDYLI